MAGSLDSDSIRWRLGRLASRSDRTSVFGARTHQFLLNPPLAESDVDRISHEFGFEAPSAYRVFLTDIGNGGAGPGDGLFRWGHWPDGHPETAWRSRLDDDPGQPFPLTRSWRLPDDMKQAPGESVADWIRRRETAAWGSGLSNGTVPIAHLGCAIWLILVVTGDLAGNVWVDDRASDGGLHPARQPDGSAHTFTSLYLEWLAHAEEGKSLSEIW